MSISSIKRDIAAYCFSWQTRSNQTNLTKYEELYFRIDYIVDNFYLYLPNSPLSINNVGASKSVAKTKPFMEKIYRYIFQRSATFVLAGVIGAFYMERAVDVICDNIFDKVNEGKQFHDLVKKLESEGKV
ncbi:Cytochrome b-c1 complex subunit 9 [Trichinella sp. T8]|nr:Cytochrome b-c1 complex subunit 9 [Trichinella sp. T8]